MRLASAILAAIPLSALSAASQESTLKQLTDRMAQTDQVRDAGLKGYTATRRYTLTNRRFNRHAEMTVRVSYTAPGNKEFQVISESGSGWIRSHVFWKLLKAEMANAGGTAQQETRITPDNYDFRMLGTETASGRTCHLLEAKPKTKNKYLFQGRVWVDAEDSAVTRTEGSPAQNPSFWITKVHFVHQYEKVGPYWLALSNISETEVRVFGTTELKIEYLDYVINAPQRAAAGGDK